MKIINFFLVYDNFCQRILRRIPCPIIEYNVPIYVIDGKCVLHLLFNSVLASKEILKGVSFIVKPGETLALVGYVQFFC